QLTPDDPQYVARYRRPQPSLPFEANTIWAEAVCVNIRVRPEALRPLVPAPFELDLYNDWGFVTLTASRLKAFGVGMLPGPLRMNRGPWQVRIPEIVDHYLGYIHDGPFPPGAAELDSVFYFQNTPYRWLPLLKERLPQDDRHRAARG